MDRYMFRKTWMGFVFVLFLAANPARLWAGPPFETDDPEPTDYRHWEIYFGTTGQQILGQSWTGTAPFLELNYGGLPDTQFSLTEQAAFSSVGGSTYYGYGDTLAGVKYRFIHEGAEIPQAAFFPQINIPTGDATKGLGAGVAQYLLPIWIQKSWDPWTTYGGAGYWINPGTGNKNWLFLGWELQRDFGKNLTLGGEVFYHEASTTAESNGAGFNLGGMVHLDEVNHIVFSLGRDLIQTTYTFTGYAAYEWTFPNEAEEKAQ